MEKPHPDEESLSICGLLNFMDVQLKKGEL